MSDDLIKRSDAIKAVADYFDYSRRFVEGILNEVQSADRPQGEWVSTLSGHWKCSRCNCRAGFWFEEENSCEWDMDMSEWLSDYCPHCGADMRKGADDE